MVIHGFADEEQDERRLQKSLSNIYCLFWPRILLIPNANFCGRDKIDHSILFYALYSTNKGFTDVNLQCILYVVSEMTGDYRLTRKRRLFTYANTGTLEHN